ncbi:MAG: hypothetical protein AB2A00_18965 [Myxococcota bacterium]
MHKPVLRREILRCAGVALCFLSLVLAGAPVRAQEDLPPVVNGGTQPCEPPDTCASNNHATPQRVVDDDDSGLAWGQGLRAALAGLATAGAIQGAALGAALGLASAAAVVTLPNALRADTNVCVGFFCLLTPVQGLILTVGTLASSVAAPAAIWALTHGTTRYRVRTGPLVAAWTLPLIVAVALAGVAQYVLHFGNCFCTTCGVLMFSSFLVSNYGWPGANAEYYSMRRVGPVCFYGCFFSSQLCVLGTLASGSSLSALLSGLWVAHDAESPEAMQAQVSSATELEP